MLLYKGSKLPFLNSSCVDWKYVSCLDSTNIGIINIPNVPYIDAIITSINGIHTVEISIYNIVENCIIIVSGYKEGKLVTSENRYYDKKSEIFIVTGNIDEIKVMLWNNIYSLKPLCEVEDVQIYAEKTEDTSVTYN